MSPIDILVLALACVLIVGGAAFVVRILRTSRPEDPPASPASPGLPPALVLNVLDAMADAVFLIGLDNRITAVNRRAVEMTGYAAKDLVGHRLAEFLSGEADTTTIQRSSRPREQDLRTRSGKRLSVVAVFRFTDAAPGQPPLTICIVSDHSEEHRLERQLEQAVLLAESALRARNQLAATLVDAGLPPVAQLREAAIRLQSAGLASAPLADVRQIQNNGEALAKIINGLVEQLHGIDVLGRVAHPVDLGPLLADVCQALQPAAVGAQLHWHLAPDVPPTFLGNDAILHDILLLLGRYMLSIGRPEQLRFAVENAPGEADRLVFSIDTNHDHDAGSSASMIGRLTGTQLALTTARLLIHSVGGKLWQADDDPAAPLCFTIRMVRSGAGAQNPAHSATSLWRTVTKGRPRTITDEAPLGRKGDVLVVDDSPQARDVMAHHVRSWGYDVEVADSGNACLDLVGRRTFDVILLDVLLPDLDGIEVITAIRKRKLAADTAILMISALDEKGSITACLEQGAQDYLTKPINPAVLRARLANIFEKKSLADQTKQQLAQLAAEMRRSDALLRVILPDSVADELLAHEAVAARRHEGVAVLFADIVGFTAYCETHPAEEVVAQLQVLITELEELCARHGVLKIKTLGDALMACAGLLDGDPDPVARCVDLGHAMLAAVHRHHAGWTMRIGVHVGHVVSGIVGRRQFLYDIWGDTVNTAQRIEHHGAPGRVNLSPAAVAALPPHYRAASIGTIELKGKGPTELFAAELPEAPAQAS